jgi:hypothetical protein
MDYRLTDPCISKTPGYLPAYTGSGCAKKVFTKMDGVHFITMGCIYDWRAASKSN